MIKSENWQALNLLQERYREQVKCIYIDPPYNTKKDDFLYKDNYKSSSWLSMVCDRIHVAKDFLKKDGVFFSSIDRNEVSKYQIALSDVFGAENAIGEIVWRNARDNNPTQIAIEHEYIVCLAKDITSTDSVWKNKCADSKELLLNEYHRLKNKNLTLGQIQKRIRDFIRDNKTILGEVDRYKFVDENGIYTGSQSVHNPHPGGYEYEIPHPVTKKPMNIPANGYRFPFNTLKQDYIDKDRIIYGPDENRIIQIKLYLEDYQDSLRSVIDLDGRLGIYALNALFGNNTNVFTNPKPPQLIERLISFGTAPETVILDFFAGSGTTVHSVLEMARNNDTSPKYLAIDLSDYIIQIAIPRVKKIAYSSNWKDGNPQDTDGQSHIFKYMVLEQYEDTLDNIEFLDKDGQLQQTLFSMSDYMLRYFLDVETRESPCRLNVDRLATPFAYSLRVRRDVGFDHVPVDEDGFREVTADLVETFNYLLGLHVRRRVARHRGDLTYRIVHGVLPDGKVATIVWRNSPKKPEDHQEELKEDAAFITESILGEFPNTATLYVNGHCFAPQAVPIEPEFKKLMGA